MGERLVVSLVQAEDSNFHKGAKAEQVIALLKPIQFAGDIWRAPLESLHPNSAQLLPHFTGRRMRGGRVM